MRDAAATHVAFRRVTYHEADALRGAAVSSIAALEINKVHIRLSTPRLEKTWLRGPGPKCRECGIPIGPRVDAINFMFWPLRVDRERAPGPGAIGWLHAAKCPTPRVLG